MERMKKSWEKIIKTILGVLVGKILEKRIVVCCGSVYRAEWDHYGRCDWYRSYDQPLFSGKPIDDYFGDQCGAVRSRCSIFGKEVCIDNDHQFLYLSNIPVDGTVHSGNRQSDGE